MLSTISGAAGMIPARAPAMPAAIVERSSAASDASAIARASAKPGASTHMATMTELLGLIASTLTSTITLKKAVVPMKQTADTRRAMRSGMMTFDPGFDNGPQARFR